MSNLNNKPTTNNIQSVSYPGSSLPPSFLEILRVHSQLTNTPIPDIHFDPPNDHQIYFDIQPDSKRHNKAITEKFYIVDSLVKGIKHPTIYLIGSTSLLYTLRFTSTGILCNYPDVNPACKHIRLMLRISGLPSSYTRVISYPVEQIIRQLNITDFSDHTLDPVTSSICMASLTLNCNICNKHIIKDFLMCDKCNGVFHLTCTKQKKNQRYIPKNMPQHMFHMHRAKHKTQHRHPIPSASTIICYLCKKPWTPITIPIKNKYINLHNLLQSKGYISGQEETNPFPPPAVALTITAPRCYNGVPEQTNPFLAATVDRTNNGPLRTNSSITPPPNTKSQIQSLARTLVYKTPTHSPTKYFADQTCNESTSYDTTNDNYNTTRDDSSKYV